MQEDDFFDRIIDALSPDNLFYDIIAVFLWLLATIAFIYMPYLNWTYLPLLFTIPVLLFIPGYSLIVAFFPSNKKFDLIERVVLSIILSVVVVPFIGLGLNYTHWGISSGSLVSSLVIVSAVVLIIAQYRRFLLPEEDQYRFNSKILLAEVRGELFPVGSKKTDRIISTLLVISITAAILTTIFVITVPDKGEKFTEFYILGEEGMATDYPVRFTAGSPQKLIIGIGNHECRNVSYFVETFAIYQVFNETTNTSSIVKMELMDRINPGVADNETLEIPYNFTIDSGKFNKIQFLLFDETIPGPGVWGTERINSSYRDLHLWVSVRESSILL